MKKIALITICIVVFGILAITIYFKFKKEDKGEPSVQANDKTKEEKESDLKYKNPIKNHTENNLSRNQPTNQSFDNSHKILNSNITVKKGTTSDSGVVNIADKKKVVKKTPLASQDKEKLTETIYDNQINGKNYPEQVSKDQKCVKITESQQSSTLQNNESNQQITSQNINDNNQNGNTILKQRVVSAKLANFEACCRKLINYNYKEKNIRQEGLDKIFNDILEIVNNLKISELHEFRQALYVFFIYYDNVMFNIYMNKQKAMESTNKNNTWLMKSISMCPNTPSLLPNSFVNNLDNKIKLHINKENSKQLLLLILNIEADVKKEMIEDDNIVNLGIINILGDLEIKKRVFLHVIERIINERIALLEKNQ